MSELLPIPHLGLRRRVAAVGLALGLLASCSSEITTSETTTGSYEFVTESPPIVNEPTATVVPESNAPSDLKSSEATTTYTNTVTIALPPPTEPIIKTTASSLPVETTAPKTETTAKPEVETPKYGTIAIFGDSIVNGYHAEDGRWTDILKERFKAIPELMGITIENHAIPAEAILNSYSEWTEKDGQVMGGNLLAKIMQTYPEGTPKDKLPNMAILVPSANQFVFSELKTTQERMDAGIAGLKLAIEYLHNLGIKSVFTTNMLELTQHFDDTQAIDFNKAIATFNKKLAASGIPNLMSGYSLDDNGDGVAEDKYFVDKNGNFDNDAAVYNDGLHPTVGQKVLANKIEAPLREAIQATMPMAF